MSRAYCCEICSGSNPRWCLMRRGDAAVSWACDDHLVYVVKAMQREHEVTALIITDNRKAQAERQRLIDRHEAQAALDRLELAADKIHISEL